MKNLTFSPKGLNKIEIAFLQDIEKRYFAGEEINRELMYKAAIKYKGKPEAKQIINAFDYWMFLPRPIVRESYKKAIKLSEFLTPVKDDKNAFFVWGADFRAILTERTKELLKNGLIYEIDPKNYYFEITKGGALYIKYQHIIGSRFIAFIKNDLKNVKP